MSGKSNPHELIRKIEASERARERVKVMLLTLCGDWTVADALERLRLSRTRFQDLRRRMLQAAVWALEGRPTGRPRKAADPEGATVAGLRARVDELTYELRVLRASLEIAQGSAGAAVMRRVSSIQANHGRRRR